MSKYMKLWDYLRESCMSTKTLTFDEIYRICGCDVDNSFMICKKELENYGLCVMKVDLRSRTLSFARNAEKKRR